MRTWSVRLTKIVDGRPLVSSVQTNPTIVPIGESPMAQ